MKRIVCLFLALVMLLALAACGSSEPKAENEADRPAAQDTEHEAPKDAPSAENTEAPIEKEPVPERRSVDPDSIPEALTSFLARFGWYGGFGGSESFQSSKEDALRLTRSGFELILFFDGYPGAKSEYLSGEDPLGRWPFCSAYEADKADRILQTVYHLSDDATSATPSPRRTISPSTCPCVCPRSAAASCRPRASWQPSTWSTVPAAPAHAS